MRLNSYQLCLITLRTCKTLTNVKNIVLTIANTRKMMLDSYVCIALFYHSCCY